MTTIPTLEADPCGRLAALRTVQDTLLIGGSATEVEFEQANGVRRRVRFTAVNAAGLRAAIAEAQAACDLRNGVTRSTRYAIGGRMS